MSPILWRHHLILRTSIFGAIFVGISTSFLWCSRFNQVRLLCDLCPISLDFLWNALISVYTFPYKQIEDAVVSVARSKPSCRITTKSHWNRSSFLHTPVYTRRDSYSVTRLNQILLRFWSSSCLTPYKQSWARFKRRVTNTALSTVEFISFCFGFIYTTDGMCSVLEQLLNSRSETQPRMILGMFSPSVTRAFHGQINHMFSSLTLELYDLTRLVGSA